MAEVTEAGPLLGPEWEKALEAVLQGHISNHTDSLRSAAETIRTLAAAVRSLHAAIDRLHSENAALVGALKPFAALKMDPNYLRGAEMISFKVSQERVGALLMVLADLSSAAAEHDRRVKAEGVAEGRKEQYRSIFGDVKHASERMRDFGEMSMYLKHMTDQEVSALCLLLRERDRQITNQLEEYLGIPSKTGKAEAARREMGA